MMFGEEPEGSIEKKNSTVPLSKGSPFTYDPCSVPLGHRDQAVVECLST